jgi:hypothetical protein
MISMTALIIVIVVFVLYLIVLAIVNNGIDLKTCSKCQEWDQTEVITLDSSRILLEDSIPGKKRVLTFYKCRNCGNNWETDEYEGVD